MEFVCGNWTLHLHERDSGALIIGVEHSDGQLPQIIETFEHDREADETPRFNVVLAPPATDEDGNATQP